MASRCRRRHPCRTPRSGLARDAASGSARRRVRRSSLYVNKGFPNDPLPSAWGFPKARYTMCTRIARRRHRETSPRKRPRRTRRTRRRRVSAALARVPRRRRGQRLSWSACGPRSRMRRMRRTTRRCSISWNSCRRMATGRRSDSVTAGSARSWRRWRSLRTWRQVRIWEHNHDDNHEDIACHTAQVHRRRAGPNTRQRRPGAGALWPRAGRRERDRSHAEQTPVRRQSLPRPLPGTYLYHAREAPGATDRGDRVRHSRRRVGRGDAIMKSRHEIADLYLRMTDQERRLAALARQMITENAAGDVAIHQRGLAEVRGGIRVLATVLDLDPRSAFVMSDSPQETSEELPLAEVDILAAPAYGHYVVLLPANDQSMSQQEYGFFIRADHLLQLVRRGVEILETAIQANPEMYVTANANAHAKASQTRHNTSEESG